MFNPNQKLFKLIPFPSQACSQCHLMSWHADQQQQIIRNVPRGRTVGSEGGRICSPPPPPPPPPPPVRIRNSVHLVEPFVPIYYRALICHICSGHFSAHPAVRIRDSTAGASAPPPGVSRNSRSRPFPGIPASHSRSQSLGMIFSFPFPFPKVGSAIFYSHSRSRNSGM